MHDSKNLAPKKLTKKQAALVGAIVDPSVSTLAEAGRIAGYSERQAAYEALQTTTVREYLSRFHSKMVAGGIDDEKLIKRLNEALDAEETRFFQYLGKVIDSRDVVDHATRLKAVELVVKIQGLIGGDKSPIKNMQVNAYNFKDARTEDLLKSINDQLRGMEEAEAVAKIEGPK